MSDYLTSEVAAKANVTLRQLQWWDEKGYLKPAFKKGDRHYGNEHIAKARILKALIKSLGPKRAFSVIKKVRLDRGDYLIADMKRMTYCSADKVGDVCATWGWGRAVSVVRVPKL